VTWLWEGEWVNWRSPRCRAKKLRRRGVGYSREWEIEAPATGDGSASPTVDRRRAKHARREGPGPVSTPIVKGEAEGK